MLLEEAGAETVGTVLATLKITDMEQFNAQVNGLVTLGLIRKGESDLVLTEREVIALRLPDLREPRCRSAVFERSELHPEEREIPTRCRAARSRPSAARRSKRRHMDPRTDRDTSRR